MIYDEIDQIFKALDLETEKKRQRMRDLAGEPAEASVQNLKDHVADNTRSETEDA